MAVACDHSPRCRPDAHAAARGANQRSELFGRCVECGGLFHQHRHSRSASAFDLLARALLPHVHRGRVAARAKVREVKATSAGKVDLTEAEIIVSGGRGLKGPEHFDIIEALAASVPDNSASRSNRSRVHS